jgi:hypothetical protein
MVKQLSVFLENSGGRLARMTRVLGEAGVDLMALSIADTTNFGILRAIVSDNDKAVAALREAGFTVNLTELLAVTVPDRPGGLSDILEMLHEAGVGVEYLYSFVRKPAQNALILFKVNDVETAKKILDQHGINRLSHEQILALEKKVSWQ